ncbi:hypothetical protein [Methylocella sp.]|uniref:hypothetical protein n=1 Tax=Methylocella sp. TaxID=1978226 RepID=UPI0035B3D6C7
MTTNTSVNHATIAAAASSSLDADIIRIVGTLEDLGRRVRALENAGGIASARPQLPVVVPRAKKRLLINSDWPRIGGRDFEPAPTDQFTGHAFKAAWRASSHTRAVYAGACQGLAALSRVLQLPVYKVSTTSADSIWARMQQLRVDKYGAARRDGANYVIDSGWESWFPSHLKARQFPSPDSPVILTERAILVPLPVDLAPEEFDRRFDALAKHGALDRWLLTQAGRDHAAALSVDPSIGQRLTAYPGGSQPRLSPAEEIMIFSCCYSGPDRAIALAERILLQHLGLMR